MLSIQHAAITLLSAALACAGCYVKGRNDGRELAAAEEALIEKAARAASDAADRSAAAAIAKITNQHTTIRQRTEVITREKPVYRDCINDPGVERLLDDARANRAAPEPAGDSAVPGAGAGSSQDLR